MIRLSGPTEKRSGNRPMKEGERLTSPVSAAEEPIVFVIDDDPLVLGGLSSLFRSIGLRVEAFASATELLQHPLPAVPSCLVLDIRLPRLSGFDLQAELNRLGIKIPIIFITGHGDVPMSVKAMKAGAIDFLIEPVRKRRAEEKSNSDARARFALLTPRERQIMALVTGGLMNKQVAGKIGISERTVKIHRGNVMRKMRTKSLADLVMIAESLGIRGKENQES